MHSVLRTAIVLLDSETDITSAHLPEDFLDYFNQPSLQDGAKPAVENGTQLSLDQLEVMAIQKALHECGGNISAAARRLGIARNTLYRKLREDYSDNFSA